MTRSTLKLPALTLPALTLPALTMLVLLAACGRKDGGEQTPATADDSAPPQPQVVIPDPAGVQTATAPEQPIIAAAELPPPADPLLTVAQNKAASIDAGMAGYAMRSQPQVFGDVRSDVSVYTIGQQVVLIEEKMITSDNSTSTNKYYFDNGSLFLYQDNGRWLEVDPPNPLVTRNVKRNMAFTPAGKLVTASKIVDGTPASVGEYEAVAVLARAQQLLGPLPPAAATVDSGAGPVAAATTAEVAVTAIPDTETPAPPPAQPVAATDKAAAPVAEIMPAAREPAGDNTPVRLDGDRNTAQLKGNAPASGTQDYVVRARAGQLLTLSLEGAPTAVFAVYSSRGEIVADLTNWSSKLPRDGDYTIKVGQGKGASDEAVFVLNIKLE